LTDVETAVCKCEGGHNVDASSLTLPVDIFVAWLYARTLPYDTLKDESSCREWALQMMQAYAFGD
jgi:hypothetical protein